MSAVSHTLLPHLVEIIQRTKIKRATATPHRATRPARMPALKQPIPRRVIATNHPSTVPTILSLRTQQIIRLVESLIRQIIRSKTQVRTTKAVRAPSTGLPSVPAIRRPIIQIAIRLALPQISSILVFQLPRNRRSILRQPLRTLQHRHC